MSLWNPAGVPRFLRGVLGLLTLVAFFYFRWWPGPVGNPIWPLALVLMVLLLPAGRLWPRHLGDGLVLTLAVALTFGIVITGRWGPTGTREPVSMVMGLALLYLVARTVATIGGERMVYRISLGVAVLLVLVALVQLGLYLSTGYFFTFQTGEFAGIAPSRWTPCYGLPSVSSVYGDPRDFSVRLAGLAGLVGFGALFLKQPGKQWKEGVVFLLVAALILLNFTRAAVLALGVVTYAGVVLALYRKGIWYGRMAVLAGALGVLAFLFSPLLYQVVALEARSPAFRLALWRTYIQHLGFWGARMPQDPISLHSVHLAFLFYGGVPAITLWLLTLGYLFSGIVCYREHPDFWWYLVFSGGSLGYLVAYGLFSGYGFPHFWITLGVTLGLRSRLGRFTRHAADEAEPPAPRRFSYHGS